MIQILINNIPIQFGYYPSPEIKINSIEITAPPSHFVVKVEKGQNILIGNYLWDLVQRMDENGVVIFNGTIMTKNDVNKYKEK